MRACSTKGRCRTRRLETAPGEDPAGSVPSAASAQGPQASTAGSGVRDVRPAGVYPLLGLVPARELGGEAQDGPEPPHAGITDDRSLVSDQPAPPDCRATSNTLPEVTWSLRLPEVTWSLRLPEVAWSLRLPEVAWSLRLPEVAWSLRLSEVTWSLRVLRDHRQRSGVGAVPA